MPLRRLPGSRRVVVWRRPEGSSRTDSRSGGACGDQVTTISDRRDRDARSRPPACSRATSRAAPVQVSREHLRNGHAAAVVLSSGNANAATGEQGRADARRHGRAHRRRPRLRRDRRPRVLDRAHRLLHADGRARVRHPAAHRVAERRRAAADAILTTDTVRKEAVAPVAGTAAVVGGMAKGAAMLAPAMATMLAVVTTDAVSTRRCSAGRADPSGRRLVQPALCRRLHEHERHRARPRQRGTRASAIGDDRSVGAFTDALTEVCGSLAEQMARDAEGATKLARITVRGADRARTRAARRGPSRRPSSCSAR